jgi:hypothetical protein
VDPLEFPIRFSGLMSGFISFICPSMLCCKAA